MLKNKDITVLINSNNYLRFCIQQINGCSKFSYNRIELRIVVAKNQSGIVLIILLIINNHSPFHHLVWGQRCLYYLKTGHSSP